MSHADFVKHLHMQYVTMSHLLLTHESRFEYITFYVISVTFQESHTVHFRRKEDQLHKRET